MGSCERRGLCAGAVLLRLGLGVLMLVAGAAKFVKIEMTGAEKVIRFVQPAEFYAGIEKMFGPTWLPEIMWRPFAYAIPYAEIAIGVLLILGIARFWVAILAALYMLGLAFGVQVASMHMRELMQTVANNYLYFAVFSANAILAPYDCFCVDYIFHKHPTPKPVVAADV